MSRFRTHTDARKAQSAILESYIRARLADTPPELSDWTVALISNEKPKSKREVGGLTVGLTERAQYPDTGESLTAGRRYSVRRLVSPLDEALDLTKEQFDAALERTRLMWAQDRGRYTREVPPT